MKIYTKTGDKGETSLYGGVRVQKGNLRLEAYGTVDELNAALGAALAQVGALSYTEALTRVQGDLFTVGAELATPAGQSITGFSLLEEQRIIALEREIDTMERDLPELTHFILPGGKPFASALHQSRTIARRAEREIVRLSEAELVRPIVIMYLNRLSDYLFVMARHANRAAGGTETPWKPRS